MVFFRYQRSKEVVQRCHKGRAAQTARSEKMYEKEKRKGKNNCSNTAPWILEVFVATNPRLEVVWSSVDGPPEPELELGFDFYGTWRPEAGGRPESPCARPQLEKKKRCPGK